MEELSGIIERINERMEELESKREEIISLSRSIIRGTKRCIHSIHVGEPYDLDPLRNDVQRLSALNASQPELSSSSNVTDAMGEFAELCILSAIVNDKHIPSFEELGINPQGWVLGLADCLGEMRRLILDSLMKNDIKKAEKLFNEMGTIYEEIMLFDVPDAILPIRRKQDIARSVVEKTRTDLANAIISRR